MKLKIAKLTTEQLQDALDENLIDLLGDVLLLNSLLHCSQQEVPVASCYTEEVMGVCLHRLTCYINQHAQETVSICRILINTYN